MNISIRKFLVSMYFFLSCLALFSPTRANAEGIVLDLKITNSYGVVAHPTYQPEGFHIYGSGTVRCDSTVYPNQQISVFIKHTQAFSGSDASYGQAFQSATAKASGSPLAFTVKGIVTKCSPLYKGTFSLELESGQLDGVGLLAN